MIYLCLTQRRNVKSTALSFPRSGVGMQTEPLERFVTQSVTGGIPTETVGTIKKIAPASPVPIKQEQKQKEKAQR